jgi:hypothetical protein
MAGAGQGVHWPELDEDIYVPALYVVRINVGINEKRWLTMNGSHPGTFQFSVRAPDEFSKTSWVDHYIWSFESSEGYPNTEFEQEWLKLLLLYPKKQWCFVVREINDCSLKFISLIKNRNVHWSFSLH